MCGGGNLGAPGQPLLLLRRYLTLSCFTLACRYASLANSLGCTTTTMCLKRRSRPHQRSPQHQVRASVDCSYPDTRLTLSYVRQGFKGSCAAAGLRDLRVVRMCQPAYHQRKRFTQPGTVAPVSFYHSRKGALLQPSPAPRSPPIRGLSAV